MAFWPAREDPDKSKASGWKWLSIKDMAGGGWVFVRVCPDGTYK